jgi:signal transduction histidine kinase
LAEALKREAEALKQQAATAEILRVIASSSTTVDPVFDAIFDSALRLCASPVGVLFRFDGEAFRLVAYRGVPDTVVEMWQQPQRHGPHTTLMRAVTERQPVQILDVMADRAYAEREPIRVQLVELMGGRTVLNVPMLKDRTPIGVIGIWRREVQAFSKNQIQLLSTFADQAVIAIENVRLFNETKEALEQQTATAEILRVIASSPTDLGPLMEAVAENAARVCGATDSAIFRLEGEHLRLMALHGPLRRSMAIGEAIPVSRGTVGGRLVHDRRTIHVEDIMLAEAEFPETVSRMRQRGSLARTMLGTPLLREGVPLGTIFINRGPEPHPFSVKQIALLETFANQAVIAIENVRLFTELEAKNHELTTALDQQTATSEILRSISSSPTDVQPVFDTIVQSGVRLLGGYSATMTLLRDDQLELMAYTSTGEESDASLRYLFPIQLRSLPPAERAVRERRTCAMEDVETAADLTNAMRETIRARGWRSALFVPMLRDDKVVGLITVTRRDPGAFASDEIALLETFAAQAVIAIENVRLFKQLEARTQDLTRSVGELTALSEVGRTLSATLDLDTVLQTIVTRASQLAGTDACSVFEYDEVAEVFRLRASSYRDPGEAATLEAIGRATPIPKGQGVASRAAASRQPVQVSDITVEGSYESPIRGPLVRAGYRAILTVPLFLEERVIGALGVSRKTPGEFAPEIVRLLTTFATQSALAIQNARLFREIADKSRLLEAASRHKSEFLANMSHELRTPLNAILGFSEVLAERMFGEVNEKQAEYLQDILSSGRHLLSLINDILDLSKVEAGRLELELERFHLPTALDNALTLVRERATRHGITLTQTVGAGVGDIVADERKVKQVLLNLLSNAVKFTPDGGRVDLTATVAEDVITIAVSDTGIGIAQEDQAAIFEEFRQVGRDDARKQEGTGLGLTLAKKFVELHGGRIWVQSQLGHGATFTFSLPVRPERTTLSER